MSAMTSWAARGMFASLAKIAEINNLQSRSRMTQSGLRKSNATGNGNEWEEMGQAKQSIFIVDVRAWPTKGGSLQVQMQGFEGSSTCLK